MTRSAAGLANHFVSVLALSLVLGATWPQPARAACVGDCSGDSEVTVDEIITMVNIALGTAAVSTCTPGDSNGDGEITVDEIVAAVNTSLSSCPVGSDLGTRRFTLNQAHSPFTAVLGPGVAIPLGGFRGQTNGVVEPAFLDLKAGAPDANGFASIDITAASEYIFIDARPTAPLVLCIKPIVPAIGAGLVECNGGLDFSIALTANHHLGQIGVNGYTAPQCLSTCTSLGVCGSIESPNQICSAGNIGEECRGNSDCETSNGAGDGVCGLGRLCTAGRRGIPCSAHADCDQQAGDGHCGPQPKCTDGKQGSDCRDDEDCDTEVGAFDGVCGNQAAHPGVCNGSFEAGQVGGDSGPGAVTIAPAAGLTGLPVELSIETATPCGDEGAAAASPFALTSGIARATIKNFSNADQVCSDGSPCMVDSDCDAVDGAGKGVCGTTLTYDAHGENFSCTQWTNPDGPGCLVLVAPTLDSNPRGGDLVTAFKFCGH